MRRAVGSGDGLLGHGNAAWVGVLDNRNAGALVVPRGAPSGIRILVVVVAHLLAIELSGIGKALGTDAGNGGRLVRVLAVAQRGGLPLLAELVHEPGGDGRIIIRGVQESIAGKATALLQGKATVGDGFHGFTVAGRVYHNGDRRVVLGGCAHHGRAADINLFHAAIKVRARGHGLAEGIQVDHDELERLYLELGELVEVIFLAGIGQDAGVHARVQRLNATFQALREAGELFYRSDLDA